MTPEQFCYWLQGYSELHPDEVPNAAQWKSIQEHLALVFNKQTPPLDLNGYIKGKMPPVKYEVTC